MLTDVVRKSLQRIPNRFELVVLTSERTRQLIEGARPTVDNPTRERAHKIALREIVYGDLIQDENGWRVDRPGLDDLFTDPAPEEQAAADEEE